MAFTFIDLFAGIGGFRQALEGLGGTCLGFSEIAPDAITAYCTNFKEDVSSNYGDITKIKDLPKHNFLTAGVPCQSWSIAGKNLGFDDDRGQLWNDTLYLLNKARPEAFIFENVKGLSDPRNNEALNYIFDRIRQAGYYAQKYVLNAYDYGVPQTRVRIYIVGFKDKKYYQKFRIPSPCPGIVKLSDVLDSSDERQETCDNVLRKARWSLSCNHQGFNDYFLFNDLRNGGTTIHSWDIGETSKRQKYICNLLLSNRRKRDYGPLDGNPLSLSQFQSIDSSINLNELEELVAIGILKEVSYLYKIIQYDTSALSETQAMVLSQAEGQILNVDRLKVQREFKLHRVGVLSTLQELDDLGVVECIEKRYDFKNTKISTGLNGVNRIFLPSSNIYPTLVASDTNDYVTDVSIEGATIEEYKANFMKRVYWPGKYRKITKSEACRIQGFPSDYILPESRARWMKLIGNSVAVPVIRRIAIAVLRTGVFGDCDIDSGDMAFSEIPPPKPSQLSLFD